jgi:cell division protein FtsL
MRFIHLVVVAALVTAAAYVYKIKFDATLQIERLARLRMEIKRERDAVANLRAEWSKLDSPARIDRLAQRHLLLKPVQPTQFGSVERLPERLSENLLPAPDTEPHARAQGSDDAEIPAGTIPVPAQSR